jgi:hypothetical protein
MIKGLDTSHSIHNAAADPNRVPFCTLLLLSRIIGRYGLVIFRLHSSKTRNIRLVIFRLHSSKTRNIRPDRDGTGGRQGVSTAGHYLTTGLAFPDTHTGSLDGILSAKDAAVS